MCRGLIAVCLKAFSLFLSFRKSCIEQTLYAHLRQAESLEQSLYAHLRQAQSLCIEQTLYAHLRQAKSIEQTLYAHLRQAQSLSAPCLCSMKQSQHEELAYVWSYRVSMSSLRMLYEAE